ncbi:1,4-alpha-glucan branching protein domain-containing protein [uncultured Brachyspira sp.]|uniref:glycoside hydrolase family 57 protein n=1 Tax=uncultured Brachyspira sp. TaxID=221953 RepID=UPI002624898B|nr:1,4-alpha-glucan branching protein domain-containing protein [uncultured Brachyspira sp.]
MSKGYLALVLHAHLPYVRHPEHENFLEEEWLYEAITETYIPLLDAYDRMVNDGINFKITMSVTPPLMNMLANELLQNRYVNYIEKLIKLSELECERTSLDPNFHHTAEFYRDKFKKIRDIFVYKYNKNILNGFRYFLERGNLEIITCGATHGFFPFMQEYPKAIEAQLKMAVKTHEKHMGRKPTGIWLGECGFFPGLEKYLANNGLKYFFVDTHGIMYADKVPKYGVYAPLYCSRESRVAAFGRDIESSRSVWSAEVGYPGDFRYREFYRDIGYDLPFEYIKDFIQSNGLRKNTGIKYYRITGKDCPKEPYNPEWAMEAAGDHAGNFMFNREKQIEYLASVMDRPPIVVSPYDAELFGHWWYEGPMFIEFLMRKIHHDQDTIETITPKEYLERHPVNQISMPSMSSWGANGYGEVWLNGSNGWIYRHLHKAAERMIELAHDYYNETGLYERALNQAARELLLAQSSDWAFIMHTGTMVDYAVNITKLYIRRFTDLYYAIKNRDLNEEWLRKIEWRDDIFPEMDFRIYS